MRPAGPVLVVALLLLGGTACSDEDDGDTAGPTTTAAAATTTGEATATTTTAGDESGDEARAPLDDQTPPQGANGIRVAADGTLWVADLAGGQIIAVDPGSGAILARLGADAGVTTPDDLAFDGDGRLWWTEFPAGGVGRIDDPWAADAHSEQVADAGTGVNPIAIDDDGQVYVGRTLQGTGVYALGADGEAPREIAPDPGLINGFDVGPDGRIYAPVSDTGEVIAIAPDTGEVEVVATGVTLAVSVRWTPDGEIAALSGVPPTVTLIDPDTGSARTLATAESDVGDNMAFGPDGELYVTGFDRPTVTRIDPDGTTSTLALGAE